MKIEKFKNIVESGSIEFIKISSLLTHTQLNVGWKKIIKYFCLFYYELFFCQCLSSFTSRLERRREKCEWIKLNGTWQNKGVCAVKLFVIYHSKWITAMPCNGNVFLRSMRDQVSHAKNKARKSYRTTDTMRWTKIFAVLMLCNHENFLLFLYDRAILP